MITPQLISYIRSQLAAGTPREVITTALMSNGWSMLDITEAFRMLSTNTPTSTPAATPATAITETATPSSNHTGKILLSFGLIAISTFYSFFQHIKYAQHIATITSANASATQQQLATATTVTPSPPPTVEPTPAQIVAALPRPSKKTTTTATPPKKTVPITTTQKPTPTPIPAPAPMPNPTSASTPTPTPIPVPVPTPPPDPVVPPKPRGQYTDGTYTGDPADAIYGIMQVQAVISGGALVDVKFLRYANDRQTSIEINTQAMPYLKQEAIAAQNANVDIVSGATASSQAFQQSLGSALAQAKA